MDDRTRRYQPGQEDEPMELNDVLEPYRGSEDGADRFADDGGDYDPYAYGETNDDLAYQDEAYGGDDGDEAAEDAWEHEGHVRTTMGVLNTFSVLLGVFVIFVLVAMLLTNTPRLLLYFTPLGLLGVLTGALSGLAAKLCAAKISPFFKKK